MMAPRALGRTAIVGSGCRTRQGKIKTATGSGNIEVALGESSVVRDG